MQIIGEIERIENPSYQEFVTHFVDPEWPVIVTGAINHWKATADWSLSYFREKLGSITVAYKESKNNMHPDFDEEGTTPPAKRTATLASYLDLISATDNPADRARYYLTGDETKIIRNSNELNVKLKALLGDFEFPPYFKHDRLQTIGLWLSAASVRSKLHYDANGAHNLNAQITGRKHVLLFPPDQLSRLYPYPATRSKPVNFSRINIEEPDYGRFPLFREAKCLEGVLNKGELLFLPSFWFHTFKHQGDFNSNVNFWWDAERPRLSATSLRSAVLSQLNLCIAVDDHKDLAQKVANLPAEVTQFLHEFEERLIAVRKVDHFS